MFSTFTRKANSLGDQSSNMSTCNSHLCARLGIHHDHIICNTHACKPHQDAQRERLTVIHDCNNVNPDHKTTGKVGSMFRLLRTPFCGSLRSARQGGVPRRHGPFSCQQSLLNRSAAADFCGQLPHLPIDGLLLGRLRSGNLLRRQRGSLA